MVSGDEIGNKGTTARLLRRGVDPESLADIVGHRIHEAHKAGYCLRLLFTTNGQNYAAALYETTLDPNLVETPTPTRFAGGAEHLNPNPKATADGGVTAPKPQQEDVWSETGYIPETLHMAVPDLPLPPACPQRRRMSYGYAYGPFVPTRVADAVNRLWTPTYARLGETQVLLTPVSLERGAYRAEVTWDTNPNKGCRADAGKDPDGP